MLLREIFFTQERRREKRMLIRGIFWSQERGSERRLLSGIFGPKRQEVRECWC